jgi:hypothetical protein
MSRKLELMESVYLVPCISSKVYEMFG